jgi:hypothetical protein
MAATLASVAACGSTTTTARSAGSPGAPAPHYDTIALPAGVAPSALPPADAGALTISNGTDSVQIGTSTVHFPTTVTDASWSHDGSRIAFIDANGNVATARPDGTDVQALTGTDHAVKRADPTWVGSEIMFSERDKGGVWRLKQVDLGQAVLVPESAAEIDSLGGHGASAPSHAAARAASPDYLAFQHGTGTGAQVWIADLSQRQATSHVLAAHGAQPAVSPDGQHVAFIGDNGQVYVADARHPSTAPVELTSGQSGLSHPAFTADGQRIAFSTSKGISAVAITPNSHPTVLSTTRGTASYAPVNKDSVVNVPSGDAIGRSIQLSGQQFLRAGAAPTVTLVSTSDAAALTSLSTINWNGGPLLLTDGRTLDARTSAEIKRLLGNSSAHGTVQILGDSGVVSDSIASAVVHLGYRTERIGYTTDPSDDGPDANMLYLVASDNDSAMLANQVAAASDDAATVVLVHNGTLTVPQQALFGPHARVFVTDAAAAAAMAAPWQGIPKPSMTIRRIDANATDESALMSPAAPTAITLIGAGDRTQLLLAAFYQAYGGVVLVVGNGGLPPATAAWLATNAPTIDTVSVFGVVPPATVAAVGSAISGPAGYQQTGA